MKHFSHAALPLRWRPGGRIVFLAALAAGLHLGTAAGGEVRLDFEAEGQLPHDGLPELVRNATSHAIEEVSGGSWIGDNTHGVSRLFYMGSLPALATEDASLPMSINVRLKFLAPVMNNRDMWIRFSGPAGTMFLAFKWDGSLINQIGTSANGQHEQMEFRETGVSFREFHTFSFVWDPKSGVPEGELFVDGQPLGHAGKIDAAIKSTEGVVDFGCQSDQSLGGAWEVDFLRFGNDSEVLAHP